MKGKQIDAARLLAFMQQHITRDSVFQYPDPQPYFSVDTKEFWDFVLAETGTTPDDLDAFLDEVFPGGGDVEKKAKKFLAAK